MVNDPIGDLLIQIKNAGLAGKSSVVLPASKIKFALASILAKEGYVGAVTRMGKAPTYQLNIVLKYEEGKPVIADVKRMSKPGLRVYVKRNEIPKVVGGLGIAIISTPQGIMTGNDAKKRGLGGELLCEIW
ncbi:30S ribosomal protein S8 [Candidatus Gottesmanbacteria bacterium]|nr:30S ribosomal protein S8 [Candidatus Gottesmanbacteria bacterium]